MKQLLLQFLTPGDERIGFVLKTGEIVEVANICQDPADGFEFSGADLLKYADDAEASWHTHPGLPSNLSVADHQGFLNYPDLIHYIVGEDGVAKYIVQKGRVLRDD